jgi:hypothetical protein
MKLEVEDLELSTIRLALGKSSDYLNIPRRMKVLLKPI